MQSLRDFFSLRRHKSDNDLTNKPSQRSFHGGGSFGNLTGLLLSRNFKSVSLLDTKNDDSLFGVPAGSIRARSCDEELWRSGESSADECFDLSENASTPRRSPRQGRSGELKSNRTKRTRNLDGDDNSAKRVKTCGLEEPETHLDGCAKVVVLKLAQDELVGLEIHPKWTFASSEIEGYHISRIVPGSAAHKSNSFEVGDEIVEINGIKPTQLPHHTDINDFARRTGTLRLLISRPDLKKNDVVAGPEATFKIPTCTGMQKFTRKRRELYHSERYCDVTGQLYLSVGFRKGPGLKSLGFSVVGGRDSSMGIYVKSIFEEGQAADLGVLQEGDEILSVNNRSMKGLTHDEAVGVFKSIKTGDVFVEAVRKDRRAQFPHSF
jgi:hypothetical protein